ncbi:hypothetical protein, partial [Methanohalobium sp.]|uniref:hypothetical protein n=1 Tax=Methanohalobium sp. TaxID=2837493 RepID=UPI0025F4CCB0
MQTFDDAKIVVDEEEYDVSQDFHKLTITTKSMDIFYKKIILQSKVLFYMSPLPRQTQDYTDFVSIVLTSF